jgi:AbrB family looped-hinge helix DNA binding protein
MNPVGEQFMPLVRVKQKFQITLPAEVREELHIEEGDLLEAVVHDDSVVLTPKAVVDKKSLDAYLTERLEELRAGKTVGPFGSMEEYDEYVKRTSRGLSFSKVLIRNTAITFPSASEARQEATFSLG